MIENTATAWGDALHALAREASADAAQRDSSTQLSVILDDLSRVLDAYVVRLTGVERGASDQQSGSLDFLDEPEAAAADDAPAAPATPAPPYELPDWLLSTLENHHARITALEESVASMAALLENNANLNTVSVASKFAASTPVDPDDYQPESWGSIERARLALSNRVRREHARRSSIRQTVLNAVMDLASQQAADPESFSDDDRAQLAQQRARAERLAQIDVTRDVKIDEVAGLDDLAIARAYVAESGWPE